MISRDGGNLSLDLLKNSLKRRLIRFRWTAFPVFLPTAKPKRVLPKLLGLMITEKWGKVLFFTLKDFRMKSVRFRILSSLVKEKGFILNENRKGSAFKPKAFFFPWPAFC